MAKIKAIIPFVEGKLLKTVLEAAWKQKGLPDKPVKVQKKADKKKPEKKAE